MRFIDPRVTRILTWIAGGIATLVAISLPFSYFITAYRNQALILDTEAEISSYAISQIINADPETWRFEKDRLAEILARRPREGPAEVRRVMDHQKQIISENGNPLPPPLINRAHPLLASGSAVGEIQISRSLLPVIRKTALIALYGFLMGGTLFISVRILPLRALSRAQEALKEQQRLYRLVADNVSDLVTLHLPDGTFLYISPSCEPLLGYTQEELSAASLFRFIHPEDLQDAQATYASVSKHRSTQRFSHRLRSKSGEYVWFETFVRPIFDGPGKIIQLQTSSRDISERKSFEAQLTYQAFHDPLTNLPNRALFMDRLQHALEGARRRETCVAVLFVDLDNFKVVNDSVGHQKGDKLLTALAERLQGCLRRADTLARLGGDEFTVLLEDVNDEHDAIRVVERIVEQLRRPFTLDNHELFVTASIGIALSSSGELAGDDILGDADVAMYRAKTTGKAHYELFEQSMSTRAVERLTLETDLRRAIERGELKAYYQPVVQLETEMIYGVEALVRWAHPQRGLVSPSEFIPVAEDSGLILPIGWWVFEQACHQARVWQTKYPTDPPLTVSVNLSTKQFFHTDLVQEITRILGESGLEPASLELELTESLMMQEAESVDKLRQLKDLGVKLAIDDFGMGYSSFAYLKRFPFDTLKIDRSFVAKLGRDPEATAIVRAIVTLAKTLHLGVVGEGIETKEQLNRLRALGCDLGQGFYFAKPLPSDAMDSLFAISTSASRLSPLRSRSG